MSGAACLTRPDSTRKSCHSPISRAIGPGQAASLPVKDRSKVLRKKRHASFPPIPHKWEAGHFRAPNNAWGALIVTGSTRREGEAPAEP